MTPAASDRRYDLDWLRVIAFGLLIVYHIGLAYVTWGWHFVSAHAGPGPEPLMRLINPWRMPLIFLISGVALRFAADKISLSRPQFITRRIGRLLVPFLFGMMVVVAPQTYMELLIKGEIAPDYLAFYRQYLMGAESYSIRMPTWNHLWYLMYLMIYTLIALVLMPQIRGLAARLDSPAFARFLRGNRFLLLPALIFVFYFLTFDQIFPTNHKLFQDMGAHARYLTWFMAGLLLAKNATFWALVAALWRRAGLLAMLLGVALVIVWTHQHWMHGRLWVWQATWTVRLFFAWAAILTLLGAAQRYLNRPGRMLTYLTRAIFPYYILHQTLIVVLGVWLSGYQLGAAAEFLSLVSLTALGCVLLYELLIRRVPGLGPLFGLHDRAPRPRARLYKWVFPAYKPRQS